MKKFVLFSFLFCAFTMMGCDDGTDTGAAPPGGTVGPGGSGTGTNGSGTGTDSTGGTGSDPGVDLPCGSQLRVIVRDFQSSHPDFYNAGSVTCWTVTQGLVKDTLGPNRKPVFNSASGSLLDPSATCDAGFNMLTTAANFNQWYTTVSGVNTEHEIFLDLVEDETNPGYFIYEDLRFFPLSQDGSPHYLFTTEIHTIFEYQQGQEFYFYGDDDVWIFVNDRLALDLGGIHTQQEGTIRMDNLNLVEGQQYRLDIFQAERQPTWSNFKISTSINCFTPPID